MQHPLLRKWEKSLKHMLDEVDEILESEFKDAWPLHPARPPQGSTASSAHDGLIELNAKFTLGIGSQMGRGYTVDLRLATLSHVDSARRRQIEDRCIVLIKERLPEAFPDRRMEIVRDGSVIKLFGDISLGMASKD